MERRDFIKKAAMASALMSTTMMFSCSKTKGKLKILVLGGTYFVGPSIVNAALKNNHKVTLFNRGITNPQMFPDLRLIKGDRKNGTEAYKTLVNEKWDVIIDVWPEKSELVDSATSSLASQTEHYIFISSIAVYNDFQEVGLHEDSDVVNLDLSKEKWAYSEEKLAAENMVRERFPKNHTILRCGPIKGWRDPALDLLYWCIKLNRDDSIIAPGSGLDPLQFIDVIDVGRFAILASENNNVGTYNCTGPRKEPLLWKDFLTVARTHFNSPTKIFWADEKFLKENQVSSFTDLPLWAPLSEDRGFMQISNKKLSQTGFNFTPVNKTLDDCLKWYRNHMEQNIKFGVNQIDIGLDRARELQLINKL